MVSRSRRISSLRSAACHPTSHLCCTILLTAFYVTDGPKASARWSDRRSTLISFLLPVQRDELINVEILSPAQSFHPKTLRTVLVSVVGTSGLIKSGSKLYGPYRSLIRRCSSRRSYPPQWTKPFLLSPGTLNHCLLIHLKHCLNVKVCFCVQFFYSVQRNFQVLSVQTYMEGFLHDWTRVFLLLILL